MTTAEREVTIATAGLRHSPDPTAGPKPSLPIIDEVAVSQWIGIPYRLNGTDRATGLDCRTLAAGFLKAQGIRVRDEDGQALPETIEALDVARYERGIHAAGQAVRLEALQPLDLVYYQNRAGRLHIGIWLGYNRVLTTSGKIGSHLLRLPREALRGAVRGSTVMPLAVPPGHDPITITMAYIGAAVSKSNGGDPVRGAILGGSLGFLGVGIASSSSGKLGSSFDIQGLNSSPRYSFDGARNIRSNQYPVPLIYGELGVRVLETYEFWNSGSGLSTQRRLLLVCLGELGGLSDVRLNGEPIANFPGCSATVYLGTTSQWASLPAGVPGTKDVAGIDLSLAGSEQLSGDPIITCKVTGGRKVKTLGGASWSGSTASGNPAAIIRDYLTLTRELGGCGMSESVLDDASFGAVYDHCEVTVTNLDGSTEPRARIDVILDASRSWLDVLQDLLSSFGGFLITDGRRLYLRVQKAESPVQAFTEDNLRDLTYETFPKESRPNRIYGVYIDPSTEGNDARTRVMVEDLVDQATNPRKIVPTTIELLGLSRQTQTVREVTKLLNDARVNWYAISFIAFADALALEPGDPFTIVHPILGDGTTAYKFRVLRLEELENHEMRVVGKAETDSVYNDQMEQQAVVLGYTPPPNPFAPVAEVTSLVVTAVGYVQVGDGVFVSRLHVTWVEPLDRLNLDSYLLQWSENGGDYVQRLIILPGQTSAFLEGALVDSAYTVKLKTVSKLGVQSTGVISNSVTVDGKTAPPLDVTGFDARQVVDLIKLTWDPNPDFDIWAYEVREGGSSWETATLITTVFSGSSFDVTEFTSGTKTYRIKAIDASGNYSENDATDSVVASAGASQNVLNYDLFAKGLADGTFSSKAQAAYAKYFNPGYRRPAIVLKTVLRLDTYAGDYEDLETDLNWSTEQRETTLESYTGGVKDIGSIQSGIVSIAYAAFVPDGTVTLEWAYSDSDSNPSSFVAFTEGIYTVRYFKLRVKIQTNDTTKNVIVYELNLSMDVKEHTERGTNVSVVSGGTAITFSPGFTQRPNIKVTTIGNAYVPEVTSASGTGMTLKLKDAGVAQNGTADWEAIGF